MIPFVWSSEEYLDLLKRLDTIQSRLKLVLSKGTAMAINITALTTEVQQNKDVTQSVVQLVNNLAEQIAAIPPSTDPETQAALDALVATLNDNNDAIAGAVTANTPATP